MRRSPCNDAAFIPQMLMGASPITPATSQKAADDQSPSTRNCEGRLYSCGAGTAKPPSDLSIFIPDRRRASSVIPTYDALVSSPTTFILLSASSNGSAKSRPVKYCEEISPGNEYSPGVSLPRHTRGRWASLLSSSSSTPCSFRASKSVSIGRRGSLPFPVSVASAPNAAATGSRKRSVEPLSPQGITPPLRRLTGTMSNAPSA